ncbi:MAG: multicomponent Na+:H+ antiporter subunit [Pyrococcus sp.]|uniref:cation:proton antiporter subunit C n=1 Tax=Pyrococcus sp. TaxID=33866 RepID=UPI0025895F47|nr:cation:proton antiporter subunit C [Pyrococcus sp.]MDK2869329.1 multicomponent Na+:H+ antiporter subunit [Pyrococcus sp.]
MIDVLLIIIGLFGIIVNKAKFKQLLSLNILALGVVVFFITKGSLLGTAPPLKEFSNPVDPLPTVLMLTTIVVDVAVTGLALALVMGGKKK